MGDPKLPIAEYSDRGRPRRSSRLNPGSGLLSVVIDPFMGIIDAAKSWTGLQSDINPD